MPTPLRRSAPSVLLVSAALIPSLLLPSAASARPARASAHASQNATRAGERATRALERSERAEERRSAREQERASRQQARAEERAARRQAREQERTSRRAGRRHVNSPAVAGEPGAGETRAPTTPEQAQTPAGEAANGKCSVELQSSASYVSAGETVKVFGKLTCPPGADAAHRQLSVLEGEPGAGASAASAPATTQTDADSSFSVTSQPLRTNTVFRVHVGAHRARTVVKVAPVVTLKGPDASAKLSTAGGRAAGKQANRVTFTGAVTPVEAGAQVVLQVSFAGDQERWRTVTLGRVAQDGTYALTHGFKTPGQVSVRAVVHRLGQDVTAASEPLVYEVSQRQNPLLTILSSATPVEDGQPVTISGVAAGAPLRTVTLLARTRASGFAAVATTTTDEGGAYSFPVTPAQNSDYLISDGKNRSTVLYEYVKRALVLDPAPSSVVLGAPLTLTGTLTPADEGQTIYLDRQNASGVGFHPIASATVGAGGAYTLTQAFASVGAYVLRVRVPGDPAFQSTTSAPLHLAVTSAPATSPTAGATPNPPANAG